MFWTCRRVCEQGGTGRIVRADRVHRPRSRRSPRSFSARSESICCTACGGRWMPARARTGPSSTGITWRRGSSWRARSLSAICWRARRAHETPRRFSQRVANALKQLGTMRIWLVVAVCVMTLAVLLSGSRSGLIGLMTRLRAQHGADTRARHARRAPLGDLSVHAARARRAVVRQLRRAAAAARGIDDARAGRPRPTSRSGATRFGSSEIFL